MTLEDFFTLSEMKDGLAAPSRVQELVAVMQKEKDCTVKNVGDATRQWTAVASTIAATDNKDCLDLFIQLDGLCFFDRWLKDAQRLSTDTSNGFVEESITALLRALEKLQVDNEKSVSSGILVTVNKLIDHCSIQVRDSARALSDSWKNGKIMDAANHDVQNLVTFPDATNESCREECVTADVALPKAGTNVDNNAVEPTADDIMHLRSSSSLQPERAVDVQIPTNNSEVLSHKSLDHVYFPNKSADALRPSVSSSSGQERPATKGKLPISNVEGTDSSESHSFVGSECHIAEPESDALKKLGRMVDEPGMVASASSKVEPGAISFSTDGTGALERINESALQSNVESKSLNAAAIHGMTTAVSALEVGIDGVGSADHSDTEALKSMAKDVEYPLDTLREFSANESKVEKPEDIGTRFSHMEKLSASDDDREGSSDVAEDMRGGSDSSKPSTGAQSPDLPDRRRSDIDIEYGIVDALEVARQVAQEVEREVEDLREQSCSSSSEGNMETDVRQPDSPDSLSGKEAPFPEVPPEDKQDRQNQTSGIHTVDAGQSVTLDTLENEAGKRMFGLESSQVTEVAKEPEINAEKGLCKFDLNEEVCSDDMDHPVNMVSTVSVVSASRPAVMSGSSAAPLHFEGALGWKGSAATSAFRPASPRKISDGDKTFETGGTSSSSKQRHDWLDIDLNVAEGGDEKVSDFLSVRQIPLSSSLHSGEFSSGSKKSERPNLDLNRISDDDDALPSDLRMGSQAHYPHNGRRSPSPASSSSSMQPSLRNFDLNDRPLYQNDFSDHGSYHIKPSQIASAYGGFKPVDPVISLMGARVEVGGRVEVERNKFVSPNMSLPNGKLLEPAMGTNLSRLGGVLGMVHPGSYTHSPVFGYNGLATAPSMPISSAMYGAGGPIPYMVDTRGAPVVPQLVGSAPTVPPPFSQPPFIMSMAGAPLGPNGAGPSRPNLDLNSGFAVEGGSSGNLRQLFMPSQGRAVEEHFQANMQPSSSSGVTAKRKEPEGGWEPYPLQYKHPQAPWR